MSEVKTEMDGIIVAKDLIDFFDRNGFSSIVRTKQGLEFIQLKTKKQKHEIIKLLDMALVRISDQTSCSREARSLIKRVMEEL